MRCCTQAATRSYAVIVEAPDPSSPWGSCQSGMRLFDDQTFETKHRFEFEPNEQVSCITAPLCARDPDERRSLRVHQSRASIADINGVKFGADTPVRPLGAASRTALAGLHALGTITLSTFDALSGMVRRATRSAINRSGG